MIRSAFKVENVIDSLTNRIIGLKHQSINDEGWQTAESVGQFFCSRFESHEKSIGKDYVTVRLSVTVYNRLCRKCGENFGASGDFFLMLHQRCFPNWTCTHI